jgi:putative ABC transport system permease protein
MPLASIALRNLMRQKKRSFLLGGAIAFGVLIVTVIDGFSGAFMQNVSENVANIAAGHIFVEGDEQTESGKVVSVIRDDSILMDVLRRTNIPARYVSKRSMAAGTLIFESKKTQTMVRGVDFQSESYLKQRLVLSQGSFDGMADRQGLILSEQTARKLDVQVGDRLLFQLSTLTGQQNVGDMVLVALTPDNGMLSNFSAYANLSYMNELLDLKEGEYMSLGIYLPSLDGMDRYADRLAEELGKLANVEDRNKKADAEGGLMGMGTGMLSRFLGGGATTERWTGTRYRVSTLNDILSFAKQIVGILNGVSLVVLLVLFLIIMVGILNTFRMTMYERIREIGTMRAVGMQRSGVRYLFLLEALFLALGGALVGMLVAALVMAILSLFDLGMGSPVFVLLRNGHFSFRVPPWQAIQNVLIISGLTLLAALLPARAAARLQPADALRTTK